MPAKGRLYGRHPMVGDYLDDVADGARSQPQPRRRTQRFRIVLPPPCRPKAGSTTSGASPRSAESRPLSALTWRPSGESAQVRAQKQHSMSRRFEIRTHMLLSSAVGELPPGETVGQAPPYGRHPMVGDFLDDVADGARSQPQPRRQYPTISDRRVGLAPPCRPKAGSGRRE